GDAAPTRPDPGAPDALARFTDYVYLRDNPAGSHCELWYHGAGCQAWLVVTRDTRSHAITEVRSCEQRSQESRSWFGRATCSTSPRLRGEVDLRAELLRSEASRVRGRFHRLKLAETSPRPDSCAPLRFAWNPTSPRKRGEVEKIAVARAKWGNGRDLPAAL